MDNPHLKKRIEGILGMLKAVHKGSDSSSNETRGTEREAFIDGFLRSVLPPHIRLGSGEITDTHYKRSGQLDVVVEYPLLPSLPLVQGLNARMFLAENVAAVIEVKSDLSRQWSQVEATAEKLAEIKRHFGRTESPRNRHPVECIPLFAVGYTGWESNDAAKEKLLSTQNVHAILDLHTEFFCTRLPFDRYEDGAPHRMVLCYETQGVDSLWGLVSVLNEHVNDLTRTDALASHYTFLKWTEEG